MRFWLLLALLPWVGGCSLFPDVIHEPRFHNPFPQLSRVAVLPFFNLSDQPHVNGVEVAKAYYNELQQVPGYEVMPVGVVVRKLRALDQPFDQATDFQALARYLGVDVIIVGAVTDFDSYYPPRVGLATNWYTANPYFHEIPPGYGLPWGTSEEEYIPQSIVFEAEFALARAQLKTQTPYRQDNGVLPEQKQPAAGKKKAEAPAAGDTTKDSTSALAKAEKLPAPQPQEEPQLPAQWPDPRGFIPAQPQVKRPKGLPQFKPIISHTRIYNGHDDDVTRRLAKYFELRDDARFGGWQAYLQRSEDFIRFCCYLHLTETLAARGGAGETRVVYRWPINRYER